MTNEIEIVNTNDEGRIIDEAVASFPATFGLRAFPGKVFHIERSQCYWDNGMLYGKPDHEAGPMLYIFTGEEGGLAFSKGSPAELRREIVARRNG